MNLQVDFQPTQSNANQPPTEEKIELRAILESEYCNHFFTEEVLHFFAEEDVISFGPSQSKENENYISRKLVEKIGSEGKLKEHTEEEFVNEKGIYAIYSDAGGGIFFVI